MAHQYLATNVTPKPGVLDSLADGMSHVLAKPVLIAIPVLLDALLLVSPRISGSALGLDVADRAATSELTAIQEFGAWLARQGDWSIERGLALLMPSVIDGVSAEDRYIPFAAEIVKPGVAGGAILLSLAVLLGAMVFIGFETWIASAAGLRETASRSLASRIARGWLVYLAFIAVMVMLLAVVIGGMLAPAWLSGAAGPDGETILAIASLVGLVVLIGTMFVPEAIVLDDAGPIGAIRRSVTVVATDFWQSMAFFLVSMLISPGLLAIWETIAGDPLGLIVAIVLNAGMVTSLAIASLGFYRARSENADPGR